jgi:hypothetical protein
MRARKFFSCATLFFTVTTQAVYSADGSEVAASSSTETLTAKSQALKDLEGSIEKTLAERFESGGRYVIGKETTKIPHEYCKQIMSGDKVLSNPNVQFYAGLMKASSARLLECDYPFAKSNDHDPRRGWVIVVAATPQNIAERIAGACFDVAPDSVQKCANLLLDSTDYNAPAGSNGFIYPITGFVREPCPNGGEGLIGFRHGVAIQYSKGQDTKSEELYCIPENTLVKWQRNVGLNSGSYQVYRVGRVAALHRNSKEAQAENRFGPDSTKGENPDAFQKYVMENELRAVKTGYDRMMVIKAAQTMRRPVPQEP